MTEKIPDEPMMTIEQLALRLNCSVDHVRAQVRKKAWPHKKFGPRLARFTAEHVAQIESDAEVEVVQARPRGRIEALMSKL